METTFCSSRMSNPICVSLLNLPVDSCGMRGQFVRFVPCRVNGSIGRFRPMRGVRCSADWMDWIWGVGQKRKSACVPLVKYSFHVRRVVELVVVVVLLLLRTSERASTKGTSIETDRNGDKLFHRRSGLKYRTGCSGGRTPPPERPLFRWPPGRKTPQESNPGPVGRGFHCRHRRRRPGRFRKR
jgi:hypothetical protein